MKTEVSTSVGGKRYELQREMGNGSLFVGGGGVSVLGSTVDVVRVISLLRA